MNSVNVTKFYQEAQIEWRIHDFLSSPEDESRGFFISQIFNFAETTWRLLLVCEPSDQPETSKFSFMSIEPCKYSVKYIFYLKNPNGRLEQLVCGFMESKQKECMNHCIKLKEMVQQKPEYASADFITILGALKAGHFIDPSMEPKPKRLRKLDTLSQNFQSLLTDQLSCDVTLQVKDKKYQVHKAILIARSKVFAAMFRHDTLEKQSGIVNVPDCDPESFQAFLQFLYCGKIDEITYSNALNLYTTAEKYNVQELKLFCRLYLIDNIGLDTWCNAYSMAVLFDDKKIQCAAKEFFYKNLLKVFKTPQWEILMKDNHQLACKLLQEIPEHKIAK